MRDISYFKAMKEALAEEMRRDEKVFMIGESIQGGAFLYSKGLVEEFGTDRIMDAPVAESGIVGGGVGSALTGYRPIVDLLFSDFMYSAGDEIFLKAAQWRFIHGGKLRMPLVILAAVGGGLMLGNEHSQTPCAMVLHKAGLKLAVPSNPYDAKGLLKTAIRDDNPVMYFWHKALAHMPASQGNKIAEAVSWSGVPDEEYTIPFGVADVKKEGSDVTVVAVSNMVNIALSIARELEGAIDVEVIDPRTLEPLDLETILKSVEKTRRLVIADEDMQRCSFASELGFQVMEHSLDHLIAPIKRVCAANYPIPGGFIEKHVLPQPAQVKRAIEEVMR